MDQAVHPGAAKAALAAGDTGWRRLSPLTLLLAVVRLGPRSLQLIPALAAIGIASSWAYVVPALGVFLLASLGFAWLAWARFRWRIGDDAIVIESGILDRKHRTIPFDRIQDVSIEQGLVARALDIAKVGFETGASGDADKGDGALDAISIEDAAVLRAAIRGWRTGAGEVQSDGAAVEAATPADPALFRLLPRDLLLAGLFNFSLAALAIVGVAANWFDDILPFDLFDPRAWMDLARQTGVDSWINAHRWIAGAGAVAALIFVGFATGVVRTVLTNWNFELTLGPRAFRRVRGLTTRTDVAVPLARIQAAVIATGLIRCRWGWHELRVQSLASDSKEEKDHQLVPFAQLDAIDAVLAPTGLSRPAEALAWQSPPPVAQALPVFAIAVLAVVAGVAALALGIWQGVASLVAAGPIAFFALLSARRHRWAADGSTLYIWRGWWSPRLTILPFANVQSADLGDGPLLRRLGCAALTLGVPGDSGHASHRIDAVPMAAALALRARILVQRTARP